MGRSHRHRRRARSGTPPLPHCRRHRGTGRGAGPRLGDRAATGERAVDAAGRGRRPGRDAPEGLADPQHRHRESGPGLIIPAAAEVAHLRGPGENRGLGRGTPGEDEAMRVVAVNVVEELIPGPKEHGVTAIDKRPQVGRVPVGELGLAGDSVCDTKHHGGPDQALYVYATEDSDWWAAQLDREIPPGLFGENLDTVGLEVTGALIGERWQIGDGADAVEVEVRSPRIPCITFQDRMQIRGWIKRFHREGRPGAYLKVLKTGAIAAGDSVTVM